MPTLKAKLNPINQAIVQTLPPKAKARPTVRPPLPASSDSLGDITDVCALVRRQPSWVRKEVRDDKFPKPLHFGPRCSRWRMAEVKSWLQKSIEAAEADTEIANKVKARAKHASEAARRHRQVAQDEAQ